MCGYAISFSAFSYTDVEEDGKPFPFQRWNKTRAALESRAGTGSGWPWTSE